MKNKNLIRFLESIILLPVITTMSIGNLPTSGTNNNAPSQIVVSEKINIASSSSMAANQAAAKEAGLKARRLQTEGEAIDAYFEARDMPLQGLGMKMAMEAEINGIDWRLLPAIAVRESTGGKNACDFVKYNPFGWGSCKIGFKSAEEAIEILAKNLGGNNPNTANHYDNKTVEQILRAYNPPSIIKNYAEQVIAIMNAIGGEDIIPNTPTSSSGPSAQKG